MCREDDFVKNLSNQNKLVNSLYGGVSIKCFLLMKRKFSNMVTDCKIIKLKKKLDNTSYDLPPVTH